MAYASWSVVFGEQPSAAKWNILGTNDASFNDGTGIDDGAITPAKITNPYKFYAYRNAAWTSSGSAAKIQFDTEVFDTNNNYDATTNYRYTAPVDGFYWFGARSKSTHSGTSDSYIDLRKNGSTILEGEIYASSINFAYSAQVSGLLQLSAGDYIEVYYAGSGGAGSNSISTTYFHGFLVSET